MFRYIRLRWVSTALNTPLGVGSNTECNILGMDSSFWMSHGHDTTWTRRPAPRPALSAHIRQTRIHRLPSLQYSQSCHWSARGIPHDRHQLFMTSQYPPIRWITQGDGLISGPMAKRTTPKNLRGTRHKPDVASLRIGHGLGNNLPELRKSQTADIVHHSPHSKDSQDQGLDQALRLPLQSFLWFSILRRLSLFWQLVT